MVKYKVMYIIDGDTEESKIEELISMVSSIINDGGKEVKTDKWGMKRFAYPINYKNEGYYVLTSFEAEPDFPKELDRRLKIEEKIIRHMIVNQEENIEDRKSVV